MSLLGGIPARLARFGVDKQYNKKKENALVKFARVVAGTLHHLTLVIVEAGQKKLYEAKVRLTADEHRFHRWREVPVDDPEVQHAAKVAVEYMDDWTDSSEPYELQEVVHANAEVTVTGKTVKFNLLLRCKMFGIEEKYKAEVLKIQEGDFFLENFKDVPANQNTVDEQTKKENALVEFARVVAGTLHHLTLVIVEAGWKKLYEAKVWLAADEVPVDDPEVQQVAQDVVKTMNRDLNCLVFKLQEVLHANVEVTEEAVKFYLLLKWEVVPDEKEEKNKVEVHKNHEDSEKKMLFLNSAASLWRRVPIGASSPGNDGNGAKYDGQHFSLPK